MLRSWLTFVLAFAAFGARADYASKLDAELESAVSAWNAQSASAKHPLTSLKLWEFNDIKVRYTRLGISQADQALLDEMFKEFPDYVSKDEFGVDVTANVGDIQKIRNWLATKKGEAPAVVGPPEGVPQPNPCHGQKGRAFSKYSHFSFKGGKVYKHSGVDDADPCYQGSVSDPRRAKYSALWKAGALDETLGQTASDTHKIPVEAEAPEKQQP